MISDDFLASIVPIDCEPHYRRCQQSEHNFAIRLIEPYVVARVLLDPDGGQAFDRRLVPAGFADVN
jgi:hypothetical protein